MHLCARVLLREMLATRPGLWSFWWRGPLANLIRRGAWTVEIVLATSSYGPHGVHSFDRGVLMPASGVGKWFLHAPDQAVEWADRISALALGNGSGCRY